MEPESHSGSSVRVGPNGGGRGCGGQMKMRSWPEFFSYSLQTQLVTVSPAPEYIAERVGGKKKTFNYGVRDIMVEKAKWEPNCLFFQKSTKNNSTSLRESQISVPPFIKDLENVEIGA